MRVLAIKAIDGEHILGSDFSLESELNIVSEQHSMFDGVDIARDAVVIRRHMHGRQQPRLDIAENGGPSRIEFRKSSSQFGC